MSVTTTITQTDGVFTNALSIAEFQPFSGSYTYQKDQICKVSLSDTENDANNSKDNFVLSTKNWPTIKGFNSTTGSWGTLTTSDLTDYNIVLKKDAEGLNVAYFAKDSELGLIPNFYEEARIRYRITSKLTTENYTHFKKIKFDNTVNGLCPLIPIALSDIGGVKLVYFSLIVDDGSSNFRIMTSTMSLDTAVETYGSPILHFPGYGGFLEYANTDVEDLDTRLSLLEADVEKLQLKVAEHDKILKDLPAIVASVSENVSKLYVAR